MVPLRRYPLDSDRATNRHNQLEASQLPNEQRTHSCPMHPPMDQDPDARPCKGLLDKRRRLTSRNLGPQLPDRNPTSQVQLGANCAKDQWKERQIMQRTLVAPPQPKSRHWELDAGR